jgi:arylsulfatase A-like enzyme
VADSDRRDFLKRLMWGMGALSAPVLPLASGCAPDLPTHPNVLFICIDDLNDWVGVMGGHPQAKTPHIDALARSGVLFANAHCDAPECMASRSAVLTGQRPATSGIYSGFHDSLRDALPRAVTLPQAFMQTGYRVLGSGKVFHRPDPASWHEYHPSKREPVPRQPKPGTRLNALPITGRVKFKRLIDWGSLDVPEAKLSDPQAVAWVSAQLVRPREASLFLACGLSRPHVPWYVPEEYFALHPLEEVVVPPEKPDDLADVPPGNGRHSDSWRLAVDRGTERDVVRTYLAAVSFADAMVGRLVAALRESPRAAETIVVLWSDNGLHLGEKGHFGKRRLWEEATRIPCVISAPGVSRPGGVCTRPVSLVDLFPTLVELCRLEFAGPLDGESLVPLLRDPHAPRERPALSTSGKGNHAVRSERWRYIRYRDGAEELYDHDTDPDEWHNLAEDPRYAPVRAELARWLPS